MPGVSVGDLAFGWGSIAERSVESDSSESTRTESGTSRFVRSESSRLVSLTRGGSWRQTGRRRVRSARVSVESCGQDASSSPFSRFFSVMSVSRARSSNRFTRYSGGRVVSMGGSSSGPSSLSGVRRRRSDSAVLTSSVSFSSDEYSTSPSRMIVVSVPSTRTCVVSTPRMRLSGTITRSLTRSVSKNGARSESSCAVGKVDVGVGRSVSSSVNVYCILANRDMPGVTSPVRRTRVGSSRCD